MSSSGFWLPTRCLPLEDKHSKGALPGLTHSGLYIFAKRSSFFFLIVDADCCKFSISHLWNILLLDDGLTLIRIPQLITPLYYRLVSPKCVFNNVIKNYFLNIFLFRIYRIIFFRFFLIWYLNIRIIKKVLR